MTLAFLLDLKNSFRDEDNGPLNISFELHNAFGSILNFLI